MALRKITADLNGGDAVTANGDLVFQVHDSSDDSIIATANYAELGSENTPGTDTNVNISITGDVVILDGVDIGTVTAIKIRCKDESGNESILSSSHAVLLLEDDFTGVTIDTNKWAVTNPDPAKVVISQNGFLELDSIAGAVASTYANNVTSVDAWTDTILSLQADLTQVVALGQSPSIGFMLWVDNNNWVAVWAATDVNTLAAIRIQSGGSPVLNADTLFDFNGKWKIEKDGNDWSFYRHDGTSWVQVGTTQTENIGATFKVMSQAGAHLTNAQTFRVDNLFLTDRIYTSETP